MTEKLQASRAAKKKAEKAAEAKAEKKEQAEKLKEKALEKAQGTEEYDEDEEDYVILQADSIEELMRKIDDYNFSMRADSIRTPYEMSVGQSIDFKG